MSYPVDPNTSLPSNTGANPSPQDSPPVYPPYPAPPYPGAPQPPTPGYPAQPQGYPYGSQPPAYNPYAYPPPPQPRKSNTTLWVILGVVGVVVIGSCVACGIFAGALFSTASKAVQQYVEPLAVVQGFCNDEVGANYHAAYAALSTAQQANLTEDQFVTQSLARDTSEGAVTACEVSSGTNGGIYSSTSTSATIDVTMTRSSAGTFDGTLTLVSDGTTWTIDQIDPALPILTDGTPSEQFTATPTDQGTATPTP